MKLVKSVPCKKECRFCKSKNVYRRTFHYSVRGGMRGTKGVCEDYLCHDCNKDFYR